jgi:phage/plasmid primase-like uncharacterized protein
MENDHVTQFTDALRAAGLVLKGEPVFNNKVQRCPVEGKPTGQDGSYCVKIADGRVVGWYQNWTIHQRPIPWPTKGTVRLTRAQRCHLAETQLVRDAERAKELQEQHERAAAECQALWDAAIPVETHPYLTTKGVPSYGLRQGAPGQTLTVTGDDGAPRTIDLAGRLFVPMRDVHDKLWSLQYIRDDGLKRYYPGGRKEGCHFVIAGNGAGVCLVEGYSTGASVRELSDGRPVLVTFDAGNLLAVAKAYIGGQHIIAGDNDHQRERELDAKGNPKPNVGKLAAIAAAEAVGGIAVLPEFAADDSGTDWNDVHQAKGIDEARLQFRRALQMAERHQWDKRSAEPVHR